jgi:uncharacterized protein (DUF1015 family)
MVDIAPFRGILYDPRKTAKLKDVVTPPYDVITPEAQDLFYQRSPYNIVRLDLEKESSEDSASNNRYTRAAGYFKAWRNQHILRQDERPAFYPYHITYPLSHRAPLSQKPDQPPGQKRTLRGFFSTVHLEPYTTRRILPHEDTFPKVKEDRLNLLRATRANFSPIFTLYQDPGNQIHGILEQACRDIPPRIDFVNDDQTQHRMWSIEANNTIRQIQELLHPQNMLIADGHHRYDTALAFQKEHPQADRMLMLLVNMNDEGLSLLPIHRVLHGFPADRMQKLFEALPQYFQVESNIPDLISLEQRMEDEGKKQPTLGLYSEKGSYQLLRLKPEGLQRSIAQPKMPEPLARLDVNIFDQLVLEDLLGLTGGAADRGTHVIYIKDPDEGIQKIKASKAQMAFFLNPVKIQVVQDLALQGIKMPHKSTYFYPKPLSGLVINSLSDQSS